jgi:regulator of sigma E protease
MLDLLVKVLAFVVAISVLVAVHEYGHFWVAHKLGFKVERFSIGFGRALWRWRGRGPDHVQYQVAAIPLGGYVKLLDERDMDVHPDHAHRAFNRRPIPDRIAVLAAGPAFNFLFAIAAFWLMFIVGIPGTKPIVMGVQPGSMASAAGLAVDDEIRAVGRHAVDTWEGATIAILDELLDDGRIDLEVVDARGTTRDVEIDARGHEAELTEPEALFSGLGIMPRPMVPAVVGEVEPGLAADLAGIEAGDRITSVDGVPVEGFNDLARVVRDLPGREVAVTLERDGRPVSLDVAIASVEVDGASVGRIGVRPIQEWPPELIERLRAEQKYGIGEAMVRGIGKTWEMSALTVRMLGRMVVGDVSLRNMSGPITIADYAGDSAQAGPSTFLNFLAVISISLGILNLLPIPLLDGGQILYQIAEWVKGSPLSERALVFGQQLGILFFIILMSFVFYNDLTRVFG